MKVVGILLVRNEIDIVFYNIFHHLDVVGFDELIIGDNGSTDGTLRTLHYLSKLDPRITVIEMAGPYDQSRRVTDLYHLALDAGADWVVPLDADEFIPLSRRRFRQLLQSEKFPAIRLGVRNFVQLRHVKRRRLRSVASLAFYARTVDGDGKKLVESGDIAFVQHVYPNKMIWKADRNLVIHKGNHSGGGVDYTLAEQRFDLFHAPLRARSSIIDRAARIPRIEDSHPITSWHIRRLHDLDESAIDEEWRKNSTIIGSLHVGSGIYCLRPHPFFPLLYARFALKVRRSILGN